MSTVTEKKKEIISFLLVLGLGVLLRLYRITEQSIWFDEWLHFSSLSSMDLRTFLDNFRFYIPEHAAAPFYYVALYGTSRLTGFAPTVLRMFPLITGVGSIGLIYLLGKQIHNTRTGLFAALLLALSPQHIWYSQEIRPYALFLFLSLASVYLLVLYCATRRYLFFALQCLVNLLLIFTHAFAFMILLPQVIYVYYRQGARKALLWSMVHGVYVALLFFSIMNMPHISVASDHILPAPGLMFTLMSATSKDIVSCHADLMPVWNDEALTPPTPWLQQILTVRPAFDFVTRWFIFGMVCFFSVVVLLRHCHCLLCAAKRKFMTLISREPSFPGDEPAVRTFESRAVWTVWGVDGTVSLLLVLLVFLPACTMAFCQGLFGKPFTGPSYDVYNMLGVYLIMGVISSALNLRILRFTAITVILLYGYQNIIFLPYSTRPEWRLAAGYIRDNAGPDDLILDEWMLGPVSRRHPYLLGIDLPVSLAASYADACHQAVKHLQDKNTQTYEESLGSVSVWLLTEPPYVRLGMPSRIHPLEVLSGGLSEHGLRCDIHEFPGGSNIAVVRIQQAPGQLPRFPTPNSTPFHSVDYNEILDCLEIEPESDEQHQHFLDALQQAVGIWPPIYSHSYITQVLTLIINDNWELAQALSRNIILNAPSYGMAYYSRGMALAAMGEDARSLSYFQHAYAHYPAMRRASKPFTDALCRDRDFDAAFEALKGLEAFPCSLFSVAAAHVLKHRQSQIKTDTGGGVESCGSDSNSLFTEAEMFSTARIPDPPKTKLEMQLMDESRFAQSPPVWIDTLVEVQQSRSGLFGMIPIHKHLARAVIEFRYRLSGDARSAVERYKRLAGEYPFEMKLYERGAELLALTDDWELYVPYWMDSAQSNPELKPWAARNLADAAVTWLSKNDPKAALYACEAAFFLDPENPVHAFRLGQIYEITGMTGRAISVYRSLLRNIHDIPNLEERIRALEKENDISLE